MVRKRYRLYFDEYPTVAIVPWTESGAFKNIIKFKNNNNPEKTKLRQLTKEQINFIYKKKNGFLLYQEYFNLLGGNSSLPIWHQKEDLRRYLELCGEIVDSENLANSSPPSVPIYGKNDLKPNKVYKEFKIKFDSGELIKEEIDSTLKKFIKVRFFIWNLFDN